jgi:hypothetical protein
MDTQTAVRNAVDEFHDGYRWGAMGSMLPHVRPADQDSFTTGYQEQMEGVAIADYEVQRLQIADDSESAKVWVSFSWYREDEMIVHEAYVREEWVDAGGTWCRGEVVVERGELP